MTGGPSIDCSQYYFLSVSQSDDRLTRIARTSLDSSLLHCPITKPLLQLQYEYTLHFRYHFTGLDRHHGLETLGELQAHLRTNFLDYGEAYYHRYNTI